MTGIYRAVGASRARQHGLVGECSAQRRGAVETGARSGAFIRVRMTITEIAAQLKRSIKTISTQKNAAMRELGIERDSELFQYAQSNGLLNLSAYVGDGNLDDTIPAST
jgi:hypothetical protein